MSPHDSQRRSVPAGSRPPTIMVSCGEPSGDLYAGALVDAIRTQAPDARVFGFGGDRLRAAGADLVGDYRGLAVTGIVEALGVLPSALRMHRALVARAAAERPDVLVVIDFPDFNFRLARSVHELGVPVVYYICPQIWAWRPGRMRAIRELIARALVIFPFEEPFYREAGVPVEFVGHPLIELATVSAGRDEFLRGEGLDPAAPTVALLPGSRSNEVRRILPTVVDAVPLIRARVPGAQFVLARAPHLPDRLFGPVQEAAPVSIRVVEGRSDDVLAAADVAVTASGTATVQSAIHECPMVIVYRLSPLTYRLGKPFVRVDTYGMANLVAGERVAPELIQDGFTAEAVADHAVQFLTDAELAARTRIRLREVRQKLGEPGASRRAAANILHLCGAGPASLLD